MRIIEFSDTFYPIMDGVGNVVFQYATHLGRKGHECYVVAPETDTGWRGGWPFELVDYRGTRIPRLKSYEAGLPRMDLHYARRMNMIQADIVHAHSPFLSGREAQASGTSIFRTSFAPASMASTFRAMTSSPLAK